LFSHKNTTFTGLNFYRTKLALDGGSSNILDITTRTTVLFIATSGRQTDLSKKTLFIFQLKKADMRATTCNNNNNNKQTNNPLATILSCISIETQHK
jgi:hypothetical protein